jgi:hypothetical protein
VALEERDLVLLEEVGLDALAEPADDAVRRLITAGKSSATLSAVIPNSLRFTKSL